MKENVSEQLLKITLLEHMVGKDAPLKSKVRCWLAMDRNKTTKEHRDQRHTMAMQALNLANDGFGWHTTIREYVDGPGSPFVEVSIGHIIDRYELIWFVNNTPGDSGAMSAPGSNLDS